MRSRAARLTLLVLFIVSLGATAYLFWSGEQQAGAQSAALRTFEAQARTTSRALIDTRAAQQAYVAAGQAGEFWPKRVAEGISAVQAGLAALRGAATAAQAISEIDAAGSTLDDFAQMDRRAREYTRTGQNLLASDLIFGDGLAMTAAVDARIEEARTAELAAGETSVATFRSRQLFALTAAAAAATLVILLLLPGADPEGRASVPSVGERQMPVADRRAASIESPDLEIELEGWRPPTRLSEVEEPARIPEPAAAPPPAPALRGASATAAATAAAASPSQALPTDFRGLASLCTDLARVIDTEQLPSLLDRASSVLNARGIILWIADPDGRELNAIVAHGYPAQLVNRLGTIAWDAENATAAAFRTSLLQTVNAGENSNGAIAAPLVTPGGCVGVMAAEVRRDAEREESRLAAAAIVAAQLATLVGPPHRQGRTEAAGA